MILLFRKIHVLRAACLCVAITACSGANNAAPVSKTALMLDTVITVSVYGPNADTVLSGAFDLCERYENMLSKTVPGSDVYNINLADGQFVAVSGETAALIQKSVEYSELSEGVFDITIGAAMALWDFDAEKENLSLPAPEALQKAIATAGYQHVEFDGNRIRLTKKGAQIDLGAIAKGFIADKLAEYLTGAGVPGAIIDLGGNILTVGEKPDQTPWIVGIQTPFSENGEMLASLSLPEKSVVSSGVYERYFELNGQRYHHILDTKTGYPIDTEIVSVSIVSDKSADGDALSTAAFGLGLEKGLSLIESLSGAEALFITNDNRIYGTSGFNTDIPIKLLDNRYTLSIAENE